MAIASNKQRLAGKVAVVTGAGRGIGRAEAMLLAHEGAKVVVNDLGGGPIGGGADDRVAAQVVEEIAAAGGEAVANYDNVATMEGGARIIQTAIDSFGRLDLLINNAGIVRPRIIYNMSESDWDDVIAVHMKGTFSTTRAAAMIFREQKSGVIVNTASESGLGHLGQSSYSAAKEGIVGFTRTIARDLGRFNVRCNAIRPRAATRLFDEEALKAMERTRAMLGDRGTPGADAESARQQARAGRRAGGVALHRRRGECERTDICRRRRDGRNLSRAGADPHDDSRRRMGSRRARSQSRRRN